MIRQLLPDLFCPNEPVRESAMHLFERLAVMFRCPLSELLLAPLDARMLRRFGACPKVFFPTAFGTTDPIIASPKLAEAPAPSLEKLDFITDCLIVQPLELELTLLGQILLRLSPKACWTRPNCSRHPVLDVLAWLLGQRNVPIPFTENFLLR